MFDADTDEKIREVMETEGVDYETARDSVEPEVRISLAGRVGSHESHDDDLFDAECPDCGSAEIVENSSGDRICTEFHHVF